MMSWSSAFAVENCSVPKRISSPPSRSIVTCGNGAVRGPRRSRMRWKLMRAWFTALPNALSIWPTVELVALSNR